MDQLVHPVNPSKQQSPQLTKMKKDGIIKAFLPGEVLTKLLTDKDYFYIDKLKYQNVIKGDKDIGNDGIIFVFV